MTNDKIGQILRPAAIFFFRFMKITASSWPHKNKDVT